MAVSSEVMVGDLGDAAMRHYRTIVLFLLASACCKNHFDLLGGHRAAEQIALGDVATQRGQEGFLVGSFPSRRLRKHSSLDFRNRLIAKFKLRKQGFWNEHFHAIPDAALYPDDDRMKTICAGLLPAGEAAAPAEPG